MMNVAMKTVVILATLFFNLEVVTSSSAQFKPNKLVHAVTEKVQKMLKEDESGERRLASLSSSEFRNSVCKPFEQGFQEGAPGSSCRCSGPSRYSITCTVRNVCNNDPNCDGREVCNDVVVTTEFQIRSNDLIISAIESKHELTGADYDGHIVRVTGTSEFNKKCSFTFTVEGLDYRCDDCTVCSSGDISADCSNIHANSTTNGQCVDFETSEHEFGILSGLCVDGDFNLTGGLVSSSRPASVLTIVIFVVAAFAALC